MSSFSKRMSALSDRETASLAERLLPDQWLDIEPLLEELGHVKRFVSDCKFEIHRIESMIDGRQAPSDKQDESEKRENDDPMGRSAGTKLYQFLEPLISPALDSVVPGLGMTLGAVVDAGAEEGLWDALQKRADYWLFLKAVEEGLAKSLPILTNIPAHMDAQRVLILDTYNKTVNSIDGLGEVVQGIRDELGDLINQITESMNSNNVELKEAINALGSQLSMKIEAVDASVVSSYGSVISRLEELHSAQLSWLRSIYDKIVECCVKGDVEDLRGDVNEVISTVNNIESMVLSGGAPSARNQNGAILAAVKAVQADLFHIRGLL